MDGQAILGKKVYQSQRFLENGIRVPVSFVATAGNVIAQIKNQDKDGYNALQLGFGARKNITKAQQGQSKKAGLKHTPSFFKEERLVNSTELKVGSEIIASEVFKLGDIIDVSGVSKGKGYAGVVKRHHFKGGPRTHGQSDRERAPGSIGQTTTPGRVYKGKRMAGRMGNENVTVQNLEILEVDHEHILIKGLVPGSVNSIVFIRKSGQNKKFVPLFENIKKESVEQVREEKPGEVKTEQAQAKEDKKLEEKLETNKDKKEVKDAK